MMRESFIILFTLALTLLFGVLQVVMAPVFSLPPAPDAWGVVLSRLLYVWWFIAFLVVVLVYMALNVRRLDKAKDDKLMQTIKQAFKDALREDREEASGITSQRRNTSDAVGDSLRRIESRLGTSWRSENHESHRQGK